MTSYPRIEINGRRVSTGFFHAKLKVISLWVGGGHVSGTNKSLKASVKSHVILQLSPIIKISQLQVLRSFTV
jgi:hypothetical protein